MKHGHEVDLLEKMNKAQREAVSAPPGATLVIAGPGSGKTRVLTRRVAYLIREMGVYPEQIMAVTFTNKAAEEMKKRIEGLIDTSMRGLMVGTFHAICARILRRDGMHIGVRQDFLIFDTDDQMSLMKQAIEEANLDSDKFKPRGFLSQVSAAKNELITPEQYPTGMPQERMVARLYKRYNELLRANNALDFDDLLTQAVALFRAAPEVLLRYRDRFLHVLVDEFQDTNAAQYTLVRLLAGDCTVNSLFCVGDPDQSIYAFRGADYRNVTRFQNDYPQMKVVLLEENYRSHQAILDAATAIIDKNPNRIRKQLTTARRDTHPIILKQLMDDRDEAQYVGWTIREYQRAGHNLRDCAIMYRTNAQSRALEEVMRSIKIPYRLIGGVRFYSRKEIKDLLAYLRLIHTSDDSISLRRIINVPARGIGKQSITQLETWAASRGESLYQALLALPTTSDAPFNKRTANALNEFTAMIEGWRAQRETLAVGLLVRDIIERIEYRAYLDDNTPEGKDRVANVEELLRAARSQGDMPLAMYLQDVALVADVDNYDEDAEGVVMLTLHAAKGLEFPIVFIVGIEENILPHSNSIMDDEQLAEERRLLYVGITRAQEHLHLSWTRRRSMYGGMGESVMPSRFLSDLPDNLVTGAPVPGKAVREAERRRAAMWTPPPPPVPRAVSGRPEVNVTSRYKPGQRVRHERFGDGTIIASKIRAGEEEIDVRFDRDGMKRLSASIAPLTLLED